MPDATYKYEVSRDYFTEAQPETTAKEVWQVTILDAVTGEMYDTNTGYTTQAEATQAGEDYLATHK